MEVHRGGHSETRRDAKGNTRYRVLIRKAGNPTVSKTFSKWQSAKDFANKTEAALGEGRIPS